MKRECSSVSELLDKYFDQEVTPEERSLVEDHLPGCPACRSALLSMENLRNLIKRPVEEAVQRENFPWVWEKIERGIQQEEKTGLWESVWSWLDTVSLRKKKILIPAVVAAVILILVMAPLVYEKMSSYPNPSVVEYIESETYNVMIYQSENEKVTLIWLFNGPQEESSTS